MDPSYLKTSTPGERRPPPSPSLLSVSSSRRRRLERTPFRLSSLTALSSSTSTDDCSLCLEDVDFTLNEFGSNTEPDMSIFSVMDADDEDDKAERTQDYTRENEHLPVAVRSATKSAKKVTFCGLLNLEAIRNVEREIEAKEKEAIKKGSDLNVLMMGLEETNDRIKAKRVEHRQLLAKCEQLQRTRDSLCAERNTLLAEVNQLRNEEDRLTKKLKRQLRSSSLSCIEPFLLEIPKQTHHKGTTIKGTTTTTTTITTTTISIKSGGNKGQGLPKVEKKPNTIPAPFSFEARDKQKRQMQVKVQSKKTNARI